MTTNRLNSVAWTEGLFLRPQHLQQHELFNEERLRYHFRTLDPFHWGIRELEVDEEALVDHKLTILRLEAILPGGAIVSYPGNAVIESRSFDPTQERIEVHLGIHQLSATEANSARSSDGDRDVRFLIQAHELPDVASGGSRVPVELSHPNVRIFLSGEERALEQYETFKLAEIEATGESKRPFAFCPTYAPPLLAVQAHGRLFDELTQLLSRMAGSLRVVSGRTATVAVGDIDKVYMRYTLARLTPLIQHLLSTGETRPFEIYSALVETAGALSCFRFQEVAELPRYDHSDLYRCFHELIELITAGLEAEGYRFDERKLPFEREKSAYVTSELNTDLVDPRNLYYLAIKAEMDSEELRELVVSGGKASSRSGVTFLSEFNMKGLRIEHLQAAPTEIAGPPGFEYFKLDPHGDQWKKIKDEFTFALSLGKLESADARLYVVKASGG
jgi:type VI secretion system protein ImpJ